jgi:predicted small secreted protein
MAWLTYTHYTLKLWLLIAYNNTALLKTADMQKGRYICFCTELHTAMHEKLEGRFFMIARSIIIVCAGSILLMMTLAGCNTVHGVGKDIESAGRAIERSSGK